MSVCVRREWKDVARSDVERGVYDQTERSKIVKCGFGLQVQPGRFCRQPR
jgi:hypothetical protein